MSKIGMTLKEFREKTKSNPEGFMFDIICKKCKSDKVDIIINGGSYGGGGGCASCGYGGESIPEVEVSIKCASCGNAFHKLEED